MQVFGPNELVEDVVKQGLCTGCGACVGLCPYFVNHKGKTSQLFACTVSQGRCHAHCPRAEVDLDELSHRAHGEAYGGAPLGHYREAAIAKAGDKVPRGRFQTGGTVSALLSWALASGRIDAAVLTGGDGNTTEPRLATTPEAVLACASSKYTAAPTLAALNRAIGEGREKLAVVATPCQATAVAQLRANPLGKADFADPVRLTIGLFCTWALGARSWSAFLAERLPGVTILGMDVPPPPARVFVVRTDEGEVEIPLEEVRPHIANACRLCPDMTAEWADLSVGVFEPSPEWNTLVVRTEEGLRAVEAAREAGYLTVEAMPADALESLAGAARNKKRRAFEKASAEGRLNAQGEGRRSAFRVNEEATHRILA
ncbi:MAG: Coenzyme F420 hydrogenase/dehydrogenase, beta subunit C-terminal domain [Deltaproteobacteria bacterium]|nr:Coenzyme F420 hydrogenase/dehydrogenase, beta subunit C-terminal domain [Deltaproteobacteria bacterium]